SSDQDALHGVACRLVGGAGTPANCRLVETPTHPPIRIAPGRMHRGFHPARKALARLVGRNEHTFSMSSARVMELHLARIRHIVRQGVLDRTPCLDCIEPS